MATLVIGLRDDSRLKRKITGHKLTLEQMLYALMVDNLQFISWTKTKAAQKNQCKPESLFSKLMNLDKPKDELASFASPEEYEKWRASKMKGI